MACVNPDGSLSASARAMLEQLAQPMTAEQVAAESPEPLFKVRANLRDMVEAGLVEKTEEQYRTSELGRQKVASN